MSSNGLVKITALCALFAFLTGCAGTFKSLKVVDLTDTRVGDLSLTQKVTGKREFLFFSTTKTGIFLEGNIQGYITDYQGNPIEGVTVKAVPDTGRSRTGETEGDSLAGYAITQHEGSFLRRYRGLLFVGVLMLVIALASIPLAQSVVSPIDKVSSATRAFGSGDLSARTGVDRNDEIGDLARAFDEMAKDAWPGRC